MKNNYFPIGPNHAVYVYCLYKSDLYGYLKKSHFYRWFMEEVEIQVLLGTKDYVESLELSWPWESLQGILQDHPSIVDSGFDWFFVLVTN